MIQQRRHYHARRNNCQHLAMYILEDIVQTGDATLSSMLEIGRWTRRTNSISRKKRQALSTKVILSNRSITVHRKARALEVLLVPNNHELQPEETPVRTSQKSRKPRSKRTAKRSSYRRSSSTSKKSHSRDISQSSHPKQQAQVSSHLNNTAATSRKPHKHKFAVHRKRPSTSETSRSRDTSRPPRPKHHQLIQRSPYKRGFQLYHKRKPSEKLPFSPESEDSKTRKDT